MAEQIHLFEQPAPAERGPALPRFEPPPVLTSARPEIAGAIKDAVDEIYLKTRDRRAFPRCLRAWWATLQRFNDPEAEDEYLEAIDGWDRGTVQHVARGFGALVQHFVIDGGWYDVLGDAYMRIREDWGGSVLGQHFTPWELARMQSRMTVDIDEERLESGPPVSIHDPACGSGVQLLAARSVIAERHGREALRWVEVTGQDLDEICCLMARIQTRMSDAWWMHNFYLAFAGELRQEVSCG